MGLSHHTLPVCCRQPEQAYNLNQFKDENLQDLNGKGRALTRKPALCVQSRLYLYQRVFF